MTEFRVNDKISVICESQKTRSGFRHLATLLINGCECEKTKICYLNRTWERFEYESVLEKLAEKAGMLTKEEKADFQDYIKNYRSLNCFSSVAMVAALGDLFGNSQKDKNDWKYRMLKAGLEKSGLIMPDDWTTLDESEKERRLNGVIEELKQG